MDSDSFAQPASRIGLESQSFQKHLEKIDPSEASNTIVQAEPSLGPCTPDTNKENGDFPLDLNSPVTVPKKVLSSTSKSDRNEDLDNGTSPQTPKDGVFDPFASGPNRMILAPHCKKYFDEARASVARRLNFTSAFKALRNKTCYADPECLTDEEMFESVYENLLEAIVSDLTESALAKIPDIEWDSDGCRTPPSAPQLNGLAETCPGAPLRPTGRSRIIDLGLCRKLEF
uniref:Uncharacterized protein MANES_08G167300 n=1 Tax=Rhizophora mucronata TaxID=61149 RepID=A0A2P2NFF5_RHIMU